MSHLQLTPDHAARFASIALNHLTREYPNHVSHVFSGPEAACSPRSLHPVFYGSYDWHSCVHGYWSVLHLLSRYPDLPQASRIVAVVDANFTEEKFAAEATYFSLPGNRGFERPYGWGWLLALAGKLEELRAPQAARWSRAIAPLRDTVLARFEEFLPKLTYPVRVGTHFNLPFALSLAHGYACRTRRAELSALIADAARRWFLEDVDCQAWEPGGDEFLSPALMEAELMRRVLPGGEFIAWFDRFLPHLAAGQPATLFKPAVVADRTDGKIAHLDGLNLSRAWCQRSLAHALPQDDPRRAMLEDAAQRHLASSLPHIGDDYMGEHWLATFAILALEGGSAV